MGGKPGGDRGYMPARILQLFLSKLPEDTLVTRGHFVNTLEIGTAKLGKIGYIDMYNERLFLYKSLKARISFNNMTEQDIIEGKHPVPVEMIELVTKEIS